MGVGAFVGTGKKSPWNVHRSTIWNVSSSFNKPRSKYFQDFDSLRLVAHMALTLTSRATSQPPQTPIWNFKIFETEINIAIKMASSTNTLRQSPKEVIMVRPACFGFNEETLDNAFQKFNSDLSERQIHEAALKEFEAVVDLLKSNKITVIIFNDSAMPTKPDAVFPNNWFSTHDDGTVVIYPMMAPIRRQEPRMDIIKFLEDVYQVDRVIGEVRN